MKDQEGGDRAASAQYHVAVPGAGRWGYPTRSSGSEKLHGQWPRIDFVLEDPTIDLRYNSLKKHTLIEI